MVGVDVCDGQVVHSLGLGSLPGFDDPDQLAIGGAQLVTDIEVAGIDPAALVVDPKRST